MSHIDVLLLFVVDDREQIGSQFDKIICFYYVE